MPYYTMESVWHAGLSMGELTARDEDIFRMSDLIPPLQTQPIPVNTTAALSGALL